MSTHSIALGWVGLGSFGVEGKGRGSGLVCIVRVLLVCGVIFLGEKGPMNPCMYLFYLVDSLSVEREGRGDLPLHLVQMRG